MSRGNTNNNTRREALHERILRKAIESGVVQNVLEGTATVLAQHDAAVRAGDVSVSPLTTMAGKNFGQWSLDPQQFAIGLEMSPSDLADGIRGMIGNMKTKEDVSAAGKKVTQLLRLQMASANNGHGGLGVPACHITLGRTQSFLRDLQQTETTKRGPKTVIPLARIGLGTCACCTSNYRLRLVRDSVILDDNFNKLPRIADVIRNSTDLVPQGSTELENLADIVLSCQTYVSNLTGDNPDVPDITPVLGILNTTQVVPVIVLYTKQRIKGKVVRKCEVVCLSCYLSWTKDEHSFQHALRNAAIVADLLPDIPKEVADQVAKAIKAERRKIVDELRAHRVPGKSKQGQNVQFVETRSSTGKQEIVDALAKRCITAKLQHLVTGDGSEAKPYRLTLPESEVRVELASAETTTDLGALISNLDMGDLGFGTESDTVEDEEVSDLVSPDEMNVSQLKDELRARGLDSKGKKAELLERLKASMEVEE